MPRNTYSCIRLYLTAEFLRPARKTRASALLTARGSSKEGGVTKFPGPHVPGVETKIRFGEAAVARQQHTAAAAAAAAAAVVGLQVDECHVAESQQINGTQHLGS